MDGLRILITNITLALRTGTETYVRDLAFSLLRRGHTPIVYCTHLGEVADELRAGSVAVTDDLQSMAAAPDVIHGHHHPETMTALLHFPGVPAVSFCHDRLSWHDLAPRFPRVRRHVAVDYTCRERLILEEGIPEDQVRVIQNAVDLERFRPRGPLPTRPQRALVFSHNACADTHLRAVQEACRRADVALDVIGQGAGKSCAHPETVLGNYDLVFAKARCALEALACGAAVILCDAQGSGPLVTAGEFNRLRRFNLGMRTLRFPLNPDLLAKEIARYDSQDAAETCRHVRAEAGLELAVDALTALYREVIAEQGRSAAPDSQEESRAAAAYLRRAAAFNEMYALMDRAAQSERHGHALQGQYDKLHAVYEAQVREVETLRVESAHLRSERVRELEALRAESVQLRSGRVREVEALRAESVQLRSERDRLDQKLKAVHRSATIRLRNRLLGLPLLGRCLKTLAHS
jgi:hypothetical protein